MAIVRRSATMHASPETIWGYLADPANWSQWDPDITGVGTTEVGIVDGRRWPVRVKPGLSATLVFGDVVMRRSFDWDVRALGGLIESRAEFRLGPTDEPGLAVFHYEFELQGPLGRLLGGLLPTAIVTAVEAGLANIAAAVDRR